MTAQLEIDRREFLKTTAKSSAALVLGFYLPVRASAQDVSDDRAFRPNAWIRITSDNQITVLTEMPEMGQGPRTVDTMMLADEMEADWSERIATAIGHALAYHQVIDRSQVEKVALLAKQEIYVHLVMGDRPDAGNWRYHAPSHDEGNV